MNKTNTENISRNVSVIYAAAILHFVAAHRRFVSVGILHLCF